MRDLRLLSKTQHAACFKQGFTCSLQNTKSNNTFTPQNIRCRNNITMLTEVWSHAKALIKTSCPLPLVG